MAPEVKKIAQQYVREQLENMAEATPATPRQVDAAVKKVAAAIQEIRTAAATHQPRPKSR
jgi:hypothetical protein